MEISKGFPGPLRIDNPVRRLTMGVSEGTEWRFQRFRFSRFIVGLPDKLRSRIQRPFAGTDNGARAAGVQAPAIRHPGFLCLESVLRTLAFRGVQARSKLSPPRCLRARSTARPREGAELNAPPYGHERPARGLSV